MNLSTFALLGLLAVAAPPTDATPLNTRSLQIPINVNPERRGEIRELLLFVDAGQGWTRHSVATPSQESFLFQAPADGLYQFTVQVFDTQGRREPADIYSAPAGRKVLIDTTPPSVKIKHAERSGDDLTVGWEITEPNPQIDTLKLEYRAADAGATGVWNVVPLTSPALLGQTRFRPTIAGPLTVRLSLTDIVNHPGAEQRDVGTSTPPAQVVSTAQPMTPTPAPAAQPTPTTTFASPIQTVNNQEAPVADRPNLLAAAGNVAAPPSASAFTPPTLTPPVTPLTHTTPTPAPSAPAENIYRPETVNSSPSPTPAVAPPTPPISAIQIIKEPIVQLAYEVTKCGPSGLRAVELWITRDDGRTWEKCAEDTDRVSPITATLPGEGAFGLRLVLYSGAGFTNGPPQSGDVPELRVEVDSTRPNVQLTAVEPDTDRGDTVTIRWQASDRNLAPQPIALEWAEQAEGPWHPVAGHTSALANTGSFVWQLPGSMPYRVYLRVAARDLAGNVSEDRTKKSIPIDLKRPTGALIGVVLPGGARH